MWRLLTQPILRYTGALLLSVFFLSALGGCQKLGPSALRAGMPAYNIAISETGGQLLLLNFVRLRYSESPYFMDVTNVFAAPTLIASGDAEGTFSGIGGDVGRVGADLTYSEAPVIVYTPLGGEKFARHLLEPVGLNTIGLLYHGGWRLDHILSLCVQRINDVWNAEAATTPIPTGPPRDYDRFMRVITTLQQLQDKHFLIVIAQLREEKPEKMDAAVPVREEETAIFEIVIDPDAKRLPEVRQFFEDLELDPDAESYFFTNQWRFIEGRTITIVTRPLLATMFYLSKGITVPERDIENGIVHVTVDESGRPFDWRLVTGELFAVESSSSRPDNAYLAVQHHGSWFYIRNNDVISKETFVLFQTLLALRAGEKPTSQTPLTLPLR